MPRTTVISLALVLVSLSLTGCYYSRCPANVRYYSDPAYVVVRTPPPALRAAIAVEARPARPQASATWIHGHYVWQGSWVWVDGRWEQPRPGFVWQSPAVVRAGTDYRYHPGYWRPQRTPPAQVYQSPNRVRISVAPIPQHVVRTRTATTARGTAHVTTPRPVVQVRQPARGTSTPVHVAPTAPGATHTVTVQPQTTTAPGATRTVTVQPRTTTAPGATRTVTVQPRTTTAPGATRTVTVQPRTTTAPGATRTVTVQPRATTAPGTTRTVPAQAGTPGAGSTGTAPGAGRPQNCRLSQARAAAGSIITITGTIGSGASVQIGGRRATVVGRSGNQIRVQVPTGSTGGAVTVRSGTTQLSCGTLRVIGR